MLRKEKCVEGRSSERAEDRVWASIHAPAATGASYHKLTNLRLLAAPLNKITEHAREDALATLRVDLLLASVGHARSPEDLDAWQLHRFLKRRVCSMSENVMELSSLVPK